MTLPKGGGKLQCYERYYALLKGKELDEYVGLSLAGLAGRKLLVGHYRVGDKPGVYWAKNANDLPVVMDGGCRDIRVMHRVGDRETSIAATCSDTIAGVEPEEVDPPVTC